ncbi:outer membrane transport energization protein TonB [Nicoletella semolina]|uniref:Outer membrane transport energization protein TonB n=1 Tax=Nicoletella semolina TaxID=271160 RepID=A0A4R2N500_9PAST|nr:energy transducer TonB [Nicoletella semolina]MDH2924093.1 hypothetical protein [Nicoletella semolina]TCP15903.1 outer membrane transport energization protein TonB [Nicoletella semolina]
MKYREAHFHWSIAFILSIMLHLAIFSYISAKESEKSTAISSHMLMVEFSDFPESMVVNISDLPIGLLKQQNYVQQAVQNVDNFDEPPIEQMLPEVSKTIEAVKPNIIAKTKKIGDSESKKQETKKKLNNKPRKAELLQQVEQSNVSSIEQSASSPPPMEGRQLTAPVSSLADKQGRTKNWQAIVLAHLAHNQGYPSMALAGGIEGVVRVKITVGREGQVNHIELHASSGYPILDDHALELIRHKSPFPPPFQEVIGNRNQLTINLPIAYNIKRYKRSIK